jgi:hypothetical protein
MPMLPLQYGVLDGQSPSLWQPQESDLNSLQRRLQHWSSVSHGSA